MFCTVMQFDELPFINLHQPSTFNIVAFSHTARQCAKPILEGERRSPADLKAGEIQQTADEAARLFLRVTFQ